MKHTRIFLALASLSVFAAGTAQAEPVVTPPTRGFTVATHFAWSHRLPGWDVDGLMPQIKELGVWGIRDGIEWGGLERSKGNYVLPDVERHWIDTCTKNGLKVILWFGAQNKNYENPLDPDAFANAAAWLAGQFKDNPNVIAFEIWNEPNNFFFRNQYKGAWNGKDNAPWVEKFAEMVPKAAAAIKKANPTIKLITGCGVPPATYYMMQKDPKSFDLIDGVTEHPYGYRLPPESVPWGGEKTNERDGVSVADDKHTLSSLIQGLKTESKEKLGRSLPVWVTEVGFPTYTKQNHPSLYAGFSEDAQAAYHVRGLIQGLAQNVECWSLYDLIDDGQDISEPEHNFGLLHCNTREPKPAFNALKRTSALLGPDWKLLPATTGALTITNKAAADGNTDPWASAATPDPYSVSGPQVYWFETPTTLTAFLWNAGRMNTEFKPLLGTLKLASSSADAPKPTEILDLCSGKTLPIKPDPKDPATLTNLPVGSYPIAVTFKK